MYTFLADIHLGTKLNNIDQLKSLNLFLDIIKKHEEECHCIFICGDLFDHRLSIEEAQFASLFLLNLVCNNCGRNGRIHTPVHFIHGTYTHDYDQYEIFMPLLNKIDNTEVFYTKDTCDGKLRNGATVLYLPQIYGDGVELEPYLKDKKYDIIIGHGPISSATKSPCKSTHHEIVHSTDLLGDISNICVFGHYHGYTDFGNNVYYAGPMLRWRYGEDEPRKFLVCKDDFSTEVYDNPFAIEYKTIEINDPEQLRDVISSTIETPVRFIINPGSDDRETYHSIMMVNKKNTNITYQITNTIDEDNIVINPEQSLPTIDNSIGPIESLVSYISSKYNIDTAKEIQEYSDKINREV